MNGEQTEKLFTDFPLLYAGHTLSMSENLICFGFEHNSGWYDLVYTLSSKLEPLIQKWIKDNPVYEEGHPMAFQVKEKFGGLRFYMTHSSYEMDKYIDEAERESYKICELCGTKENVFQTKGWIVTICKDCDKKRLDNYQKIG